MNRAQIIAAVAPAAVLAALVLNASPAYAQRHAVVGRGGFGVTRGSSRAIGLPRAFAPRRVAPRAFAAVGPFNGARFVVRPPVRLGYGLTAGYPLAAPAYSYPYPYRYSYPYPVPYAPYPVAAPVYRAPVALGVPGPLSLAIAGRIARGAGRLALRLLIP